MRSNGIGIIRRIGQYKVRKERRPYWRQPWYCVYDKYQGIEGRPFDDVQHRTRFLTLREAREYCLKMDEVVEVEIIDQLRGVLPGTTKVRRGDRPRWGNGWRILGEDHCFTANWDSSG